MTTAFIYGPQGCGKTRNAETLRTHFGCASVVDDWLPGNPITEGALHLTGAKSFEVVHVIPRHAVFMPFDKAMWSVETAKETVL